MSIVCHNDWKACSDCCATNNQVYSSFMFSWLEHSYSSTARHTAPKCHAFQRPQQFCNLLSPWVDCPPCTVISSSHRQGLQSLKWKSKSSCVDNVNTSVNSIDVTLESLLVTGINN
eukprot:g77132.t1